MKILVFLYECVCVWVSVGVHLLVLLVVLAEIHPVARTVGDGDEVSARRGTLQRVTRRCGSLRRFLQHFQTADVQHTERSGGYGSVGGERERKPRPVHTHTVTMSNISQEGCQ